MTEERGNPYLILFALWLLVFSASSQIMIISPMLPQIGRELNAPASVLGTLVSAYAVMVGLFALVIGPISDKVGRRRVLLIGAGAMTLALVGHVAATGYVSLLVARAAAGVAGGLLSGAAVSYVGDYFPYERRGWASGWIMSSTALGQIAGVPLGTILAAHYGFRVPFLLFALTMGATFLLIWRCVPQPEVERLQGRLTIKAALASYWELLKRTDARAAAAAFALMFLGIGLFVIYLPTWLTETLAATPNQIASVFFVGGLANALTGPYAGRLSDRVGRKKLIITSCLGLAAIMFSVTFVVREFWVAYPIFFFSMVLVAARMSPFQALLTALVAGERRGTLMSFTVAIGQVGFAIGGVVSGLAYSRFGYWSNTVAGGVSVLLMALLVWRYLPEPARPETITLPARAPLPETAAKVETLS